MSRHPTMNAGKHTVRDAYFGALGYCLMCGAGRKSSNLSFVHKVVSEECMANSKLTQLVRIAENQEYLDLSYW